MGTSAHPVHTGVPLCGDPQAAGGLMGCRDILGRMESAMGDRGRRSRHSRDSGGSRPRRRRPKRTPEEVAYRQAQKRANAKMGAAIHLLVYGLVLVALLVLTRSFTVVFIVGSSWGIGVAIHAFVAIVAPNMRQRWVEKEVGRQVRQDVTHERRVTADRHVRSLEQLSASIAHEIRNPITAAKSLVQQMGEDPVSSENIDFAQVALGELDRVERSISHLLRYARDEELRVSELQLVDVMDSALDTFRDRISRRAITVRREVDTAGSMQGDEEKLRRAIINLIGNALDVLEEFDVRDGCIEVGLGENLAGSEIWFSVRDNGPGIEDDTLNNIFDPFYTTKGEGTGLGLALTKKTAELHGGRIEADTRPGEGTQFTLFFPKRLDVESEQS
jgi:signal transduction histidine kinase